MRTTLACICATVGFKTVKAQIGWECADAVYEATWTNVDVVLNEPANSEGTTESCKATC